MTFSIIIPIYNTAAHLPACIDSVLAQTCGDFELVLVDDGSTDGSAEVCREAAARDARVRVISQENGGVSRARNAGLAEVSGRYVTWVDSDDTMEPDWLEGAAEVLGRTGCDAVIFSMRYAVQAGGEASTRKERVLEDRVYAGPREMAEAMMRRGGLLIYAAGNKIYRRDLIARRGLRFPEGRDFGEDRLFNFAYLRDCGAVATSSRVVYNYYKRGTSSLSGRWRPGVVAEMLELHAAKRDWLAALGISADEARGYLASDIRRELLHAVAHVVSHWRRLDRAERGRAVRALAEPEYPDYLREAFTRRRADRVMVWLLRHRVGWAVRGLIRARSGAWR
jgi:glycosyltransferase involved in cell wall biosynthesis